MLCVAGLWSACGYWWVFDGVCGVCVLVNISVNLPGGGRADCV